MNYKVAFIIYAPDEQNGALLKPAHNGLKTSFNCFKLSFSKFFEKCGKRSQSSRGPNTFARHCILVMLFV
jgi:hypothetical protein